MAPICWSRPKMSNSAHCATTRASLTLNMLMPRSSSGRPVGGIPASSPAVDAPPGDPIDDEIALRDLVVDLVGVAGEHDGRARHVVLEGGAVHGRLARHVRQEVGRENLGGILGRAVVVADRPAYQRLVRVGWCHIQCHDWCSSLTPRS